MKKQTPKKVRSGFPIKIKSSKKIVTKNSTTSKKSTKISKSKLITKLKIKSIPTKTSKSTVKIIKSTIAKTKPTTKLTTPTTSKPTTSPTTPETDFIKLRKVVTKFVPKQEAIYRIKNKDYELLIGTLHEPVNSTDTVVIVVHGFLSNRKSATLLHLCTSLVEAGVAAYRFDLPGHGDSEGRFEDATPRKMLRDLHHVIEDFRKKYKKVILLGSSLGGLLCIHAAGNVDGLITISAPTHPELFIERHMTHEQKEQLQSVGFFIHEAQRGTLAIPYTIHEKYVQEMTALRPLDDVKLVKCPVLVIHGTNDQTVPVQDAHDLFAALHLKTPKKQIYLIGAGDHSLLDPRHLNPMTQKIIEWVREI